MKKNIKWILLVFFILAVAMGDYFLHGYYNTAGYRGEIAEEKTTNEYRIACFGGSTTFGFWVEEKEAWPAQLQKILGNNFSVINLGANNQGIYGINNDIDYYDDLNIDMAILYQGETDRNPELLRDYDFRGGDPFFHAFGYKTIVGFYAEEVLRKIKPNFFSSDKTELKKESNKDTLSKKINTYYLQNDAIANAMIKANKHPYKDYIKTLEESLNKLTSKNIRTVVVCQPKTYASVQQKCIRELIHSKFEDKVEYLNLDDLFDDIDAVSFDGMHLKKEGYVKVAERMKAMLFK